MFRQGREETEEERIARIKRQNEEIKLREQKIAEDKKFAEAQGADFKAKVSNWSSNPGSYSTPPRNHVIEQTLPSRKTRLPPPRQSNGGRDSPPPDPRSFLADEERDCEYEESSVPNQFTLTHSVLYGGKLKEKPGNDFGGRRNDGRGGLNRRTEGERKEERIQGSTNDHRNRLQEKKEWDQSDDNIVSPATIPSEPRRRGGARGASTSRGRGGNIRRVIVNNMSPQQQEVNTPKMSEVDEILERITEVHLDPSNSSTCDETLVRPYPPALMDLTVPPPTQNQYATYPMETQPSSQHVEPNTITCVNDYQSTANQQPGGGSYPDQNYTTTDTRYGNQHVQEQNNEQRSFPYQQSSVSPGSYANQGSYNETQYASQHVQNHAIPSNAYTGQHPQNQGIRANQYVKQTVQGPGTNSMAYSNQVVNLYHPSQNHVHPYANQYQTAPVADPSAFVNPPSVTQVTTTGPYYYMNHSTQNRVPYSNQFVPNSGAFVNQPAVVLPYFSVRPPSVLLTPISTPYTHPFNKASASDQFTISQEAVAPMQQYSTSPSGGYVPVQYITAPRAPYVTSHTQATPMTACRPQSIFYISQIQPGHSEPQNQSEMYGTLSPLTSYEHFQNQQEMYGTDSGPYGTSQPSSYVDNTGVGYQENPYLNYENSSSMNQYESQQQDAMYMMSMEPPQYESANMGMGHQYESENMVMERQYESGNAAGVTSNQQFERKKEFHQSSQNTMYSVSEVPQPQAGPNVPPTIGSMNLQNRLQRIKQEKTAATVVPPEPTSSPHTSDSFTSSESVKKSASAKTKNFSSLKQVIRQNQENLKEYLAENQEVSSVEPVRTLPELNTSHRSEQAEVPAGHRGHQNEANADHRRSHERHENKQGLNQAQYQDSSYRHGDSSSSQNNGERKSDEKTKSVSSAPKPTTSTPKMLDWITECERITRKRCESQWYN